MSIDVRAEVYQEKFENRPQKHRLLLSAFYKANGNPEMNKMNDQGRAGQ